MRILFPLEVFYPSQAGGPANTIYWLAKYLKTNGFEPVVTATNEGLDARIDLDRWTETDAGRVIYVKTAFIHFPLRETLKSLLEVCKADVVQSSSIFYPACFFSALGARVLGKKLVVSPRGELSRYSLSRSTIRKWPFKWLSKIALSRYAVFHATSENEIEEIRSFFGPNAKTVFITNYIELPPLRTRQDGPLYILFIGRIHPKKGIDRLIRAASRSAAFMASGALLRIAGRSFTGYDKELKRLVADLDMKEKVEFVGQVEGDGKQQLLADAMWTFMPSITENFGLVTAESLAQGTPVVASKGSPWQSLEEGRVGFWIHNDPDTLAAKIDQLLAMPGDEYASYRSRARSFVEERFDIDKNIDKWLELYRSL